MFHRNFVVRRSLFLILIGSACISTVLGVPVWGGGVTVVNTILSDNGDDDGFADTKETVTIQLVIENTSGIDLTGVAARINTEQWPMACIINPMISIGDLAAGERRTTAGTFTFQVAADVERGSVLGPPAVTFAVDIFSDQSVDLAVPGELTFDLDLDAAGGGTPTSFFESFESGDLGSFSPMNLDADLHGSVEASDGYRCQYDDPSTWICQYGNCPPDCFLGATSLQADAYHWQSDGPTSPDGGRASSGTHSLYMGLFLPLGFGHTTPLAMLEAVSLADPIHVGLGAACSETRTTSCRSDVDCPDGESCVASDPTLSIKQQLSLVDWRLIGRPGRATDRGVVQAQIDDGGNLGNWIKLEPYLNEYHALAEDNYSNHSCMFDPIDDGNTEDDYFDPDPFVPPLGPSSTCYPEPVFSFIGSTDGPYDPANIGAAGDGPGLEGSSGPGTWVESKFDLSRFKGRSIRVRFLVTSLKAQTWETWDEIFDINPDPREDGWWIDDVHANDTVTTPYTVTVDLKDNSGLPGYADSDGDGPPDLCDNCPDLPNPDQADTDGDAVGDPCDSCTDTDGDGLGDPGFPTDTCDVDGCPDDFDPTGADSDGDGIGDACDPCPADILNDADGDDICESVDNCPLIWNQPQWDLDGDGVGDECDPDIDGDDADNTADNCPWIPNADQMNTDGDAWGDVCDNCPWAVQGSQVDADQDGHGDACDNCWRTPNPDQANGDLAVIEQWADVATASSEWSSGDWSAMQATGTPEFARCLSASTNWSPLSGGGEPEWLELTYPTNMAAIGVDVHESGIVAGFVDRIELRDTGNVLHQIWDSADGSACGDVLTARWPATAFEVSAVVVHTAVAEWEEIDAVKLVGVGEPSPDNRGNACDVCPFLHDADQLDSDGDGWGDSCDCAPSDSASHPPEEVSGVAAGKPSSGVAQFYWASATGAEAYSITRVLISEIDSRSFGSCIVTSQPVNSYDDGESPPAGDGFAYLIRATNSTCGIGTLGAGQGGLERRNLDPDACF